MIKVAAMPMPIIAAAVMHSVPPVAITAGVAPAGEYRQRSTSIRENAKQVPVTSTALLAGMHQATATPASRPQRWPPIMFFGAAMGDLGLHRATAHVPARSQHHLSFQFWLDF